MKTVNTKFSAEEDGFRFENAFDVRETLLLAVLRQKEPEAAAQNAPYGLCGGMCFAALDYLNAKKPVPKFPTVKDISAELLIYLWIRQMDTLRYPALANIVIWSTLRTDISLARSVANSEVPRLWKKIDAGEPAVLALISARGPGELTHNHQVLAVGYDYAPETDRVAIRLYDPNYPRTTQVLTLNIAAPGEGIGLKHSKPDAWRGFFVIDYEPKTPP